jgi:hypothetical protein
VKVPITVVPDVVVVELIVVEAIAVFLLLAVVERVTFDLADVAARDLAAFDSVEPDGAWNDCAEGDTPGAPEEVGEAADAPVGPVALELDDVGTGTGWLHPAASTGAGLRASAQTAVPAPSRISIATRIGHRWRRRYFAGAASELTRNGPSSWTSVLGRGGPARRARGMAASIWSGRAGDGIPRYACADYPRVCGPIGLHRPRRSDLR